MDKGASHPICHARKSKMKKKLDERWLEEVKTTWPDVLDKRAEEYAQKELIIFKDQRITYGEFQSRVKQFAKGLLEIGVKKGDHVSIWMINCPEWAYAQFAIYKIGAVMIPVSTRLKTFEAEYLLKQSDSSTLIMMDNFLRKIDSLGMIKELVPELESSKPAELRSQRLPALKNIVCLSEQKYEGMYSFKEVMELGSVSKKDDELAESQASISPDDVSHIMYTSGTTGFPKGAMLTPLVNIPVIFIQTERMKFDDKSQMLMAIPFWSNFGCMYSFALTLYRGGSLVLHEYFDAGEVLRDIEKEKVTHLFGPPTFFVSLLDHPDFNKYSMASVRGGLIGGAPIPVELAKDVVNKIGARNLTTAYGLAEFDVITATLTGDTFEHICQTVGKRIPIVEIKIVDPKTDKSLSVGEEGEICARGIYPGTAMMKGYYKKPQETAETIDKDGWLHTGDIGKMDEEGYYHITGRVKDMIIVGGLNVYPAEVEDFLYTHPRVKQVAVVGVPDRRLGEVPMAYIELKSGESCSEQEIIDFCKGKVANIKVPRFVKFTKEFPLTGAGKIQKFKLREEAIRELGLEKLAVKKTV